RFRTERGLSEHLGYVGGIDWLYSLCLSCRLSAARIGQYNAFSYASFKWLAEEPLQYAADWYDEPHRSTDAQDIMPPEWQEDGPGGRSARREAGTAALRASEGRPGPVWQERRWRADLPTARLAVRPGQRPVPDQRRP